MQKRQGVLSTNNWLLFLLFLGASFLIFANGIHGQFVRDDNIVLSHSFFWKPAQMLKFLSQPYFEDMENAGLYRPLTQISFAFNFLFSAKPFGFHFVNILLHAVNSFLVFSLLRRWFNNVRLAAMAGLLFLILPIHVEAVTSIVGRAELLSFLFGLLSLLSWWNYRYFWSVIFFSLALLSKESAIAVPVLVFLLAIYYRRDFKWLYYHLTSVVAFFILRFVVLGRYALSAYVEYIFNPLKYSSFAERIFTALKVLVLYVQKILFPYNLSADYSYNQITLVNNPFDSATTFFGLVLFLAVAYSIFALLKKRTIVPVFSGLVFFIVPYLPISNLILPVGTIMGDRLMYFPSFGASILLALAIERVSKKKLIIHLIIVPLVLYWGLVTVRQNRIWANEAVLHEDMYRKSPNSVVAKTNFGIEMLNKNHELAKKLAGEVYNVYPDYVQNLNLLGDVNVIEKNLPGAERFLKRALELRPHHINTMLNLSRVYFSLGRYQEAEELLKEVNKRSGGEGNTIFYAVAKIKNRKYQEAIGVVIKYFGEGTRDESALSVINYAKVKLGQAVSQKKSEIEAGFVDLSRQFDYLN